MKQKIRIFCPHCGSRIVKKDEEGTERDFCTGCDIFFYDNPLPVVSSIYVSDRSILLVKRGKRPYKGMWCLPTGFAEAGESIEDAALREFEEESGIRGRIVSLVDVDSCANYFYGDLLFLTFEVEWKGGTPTPGDDTVAAKFFPIGKIPQLAFTANTKAIKSFVLNKAEQWAIFDSFALAVGGQPGVMRSNLLSDDLVGIIEQNSEDIVRRWLEDVTTNKATMGYCKMNPVWMTKGVRRILSQFGKWLNGYYNDTDIRDLYMKLGKGSKKEGLLLSEVLSAWGLLRKHTWEYALSGGVWKRPIDVYSALELDQRILAFFDKATIYTSKGYENS